ncbi:MAG: hypothetical protein ACLGSD_04715 [Acidobacteriota bacterium]
MELFQELLLISTVCTEIVLFGIVSKRGISRILPTFYVYVLWSVLGDIVAGVVYPYRVLKVYAIFADIQAATEGVILLVVLLDLARAALRPLPIARVIVGLLGLITAVAGAILWKLTNSWALWAHYHYYHQFLREQLTFSVLRVFLLLLIGGLVQYFARYSIPMGWHEREMQIATGIGVYALASLAESLVTTYQSFVVPVVFNAIYGSVGAIYELCLIYWIVCFLRPEPANAEQRAEEAQPESGPSTLWEKGIEGSLAGFGTQHIPKGDCA